MKIEKKHPYIRVFVWFILTGFLLAGFGVASIVDTSTLNVAPPLKWDAHASQLLIDLENLGMLRTASQSAIEKLLSHQKKTGHSLARMLKDPTWQQELGFSSHRFKSTWYASNPYDLLPADLKLAIKQKKIPLKSPNQIKEWCKINKAPKLWAQALKTALRETTPANLVRAAQGQRPFAKNGQLLEPVVIEKGKGSFEVKSGHIATDPTIIPTNSDVIMIIKLNGKEQLLRVKATDIGGAVRGYHVDLPIQFQPRTGSTHSPHIYFPKEYIGNPSVLILRREKSSRGQKG